MSAPIIETIARVLEKGLILWERWLATRQQAYERKMDQNMRRALSEASEAFRRLLELDVEIDDRQFERARKLFYKYRDRT